jgi:uncharacterized protein
MLAPITIRYPFRPVRPSLAVAQVADLFGLSGQEAEHVIAEEVTLDIRPQDLVLFSGPSGSGKSSLLRAAGEQLGARDIHAMELPEVPLVEALPGPMEKRLATLAACGLSEARILLRTPAELSEGQRYRFRLALAFTMTPSATPLLADEFAALLDRPLAKVVAFNLRKMVSRLEVGMMCATTHEDLLNDLQPDVWVHCLGDGQIEVQRRTIKKKPSASAPSFGSRKAPDPTGRTSLGGIIAAITSPSSAG